MNYTWHPTTAPVQTRYDDIWFINPQVGWGVNSGGQIVHTEDGGANWTIQHTVDADTWLRCMSFTEPDRWLGRLDHAASSACDAPRTARPGRI